MMPHFWKGLILEGKKQDKRAIQEHLTAIRLSSNRSSIPQEFKKGNWTFNRDNWQPWLRLSFIYGKDVS
jgi:hypothetical protein